MTNKYYQKCKERLQKQHVKDTKTFLKLKKARERYQNYCVEQKQNLLEYMRNYYVTHKNNYCVTQ